MPDIMIPRYPIYIPSKGRAHKCLTAQFLIRDQIPFKLVIEPQEENIYSGFFDDKYLLVLPFSNKGSVIPARNWIKDHATSLGYERHWQLDDNITDIVRVYKKRRIPCRSNPAFAAVEDFTDRYENIAISGMNYYFFVYPQSADKGKPPFHLNVHVYSCCLINNKIPHRWRGRYNEDTDLCLQVLADGWCTILFNAFLIRKRQTMTMGGGNTAELYKGDGRLKMARSLERLWPGVVDTKRKFQRPQHVVHNNWRNFDTPLKLKPGIDLSQIQPNEYGMKLTKKKEIKSPELRKIYDQYGSKQDDAEK